MADDEMEDGSYAMAIRSRLAEVADRVRHPGLPLVFFAADLPEVDGDEDRELADDDLPEEEREDARLRRATLILAAMQVIDRCIDDLQVLPDEVEVSFVYEWFPSRHRDSYDEAFFRKVLVCAVRVADDLANPEADSATCTAEEIIRHAIGAIAEELCDEADLGQPWLHPDEMLQEDMDFEYLYQEKMDGLEDDPGMQAGLGLHVPPVSDWFAPFNAERMVHPYAEVAATASRAHDLYLRLTGENNPSDLLESKAADDPAPIGSFAAGSEVVSLARRAADAKDPGLWVADDTDRERSFAALVALSATAEAGSGWLEWEPYEGADTVRADPVIILSPRRHFPVGDDEPWVSAAIGGSALLAVPLRFVVSYRPDPEVRYSVMRLWRATGP
jgi:hypothetical protein